jgi:HlyD family secretion protein
MRVNGKGKRIALVAGGVVVTVAIAGTIITRAFASGVSVPTATAKRETLSVTVSVSGKTEADRKADVFAPVAGTLAKVLVTEGQQVAKGQALAEMDPDQLDAAVDGARAAYEGADSQLAAIDDQAPSSAERDAASAAVASAKRAYDQARDAYDKLRSARAAEASVAAAQTAKQQAYAAYLGAKAQQQRLRASGDTGSRRHAASVARDTAERNLQRAEASRRKAVLRAPMAGVVIFDAVGAPGPDGAAPKAVAGSAVTPGIAPFTVVDMSTLKFSGQLDESDVARVRTGLKGVVTLDAAPGTDMTTTVASIKPTATQTTNGAVVFPVALRIPNAKGTLRIGMSGNATIYVDDVTGAIAIPIEALIDSKDGQSVFVVKDGKLAKRDVKTGVMTETEVEIAKGLSAGETVAVASDGTQLKDGAAVKTGGTR